VSYSAKTYVSLLPLTIGVMLACSFDMSASNTIGLLCAFGSALVFVSSNIFYKKIMPSETAGSTQYSHKLDKINLLFYSSSMAFLLMIPIWTTYDLPVFLTHPEHIAHPTHGHTTPHSVSYYFFMNGTVHFAQNLIAFVILASTSPVTYSIASLIKRVVVICIAIVWFSQSVHPVQGVGILLTFAGLYMYNTAKGDVQRGESRVRRVEAARGMMLPSNKADARMMDGTESSYPKQMDAPQAETTGVVSASASASGYGRQRALSSARHALQPPMQLPPSRPPLGSSQPNLMITTSPLSPAKGLPPPADLRHVVSPIDSYPSPPPSLDDSPPSESVPLPLEHEHGYGYGHEHAYGRLQEGLTFDRFPPHTAAIPA
jgi:solute carrier family 35 protein E1